MWARLGLGEAAPGAPARECLSCPQTPGQLYFTFLVCRPVFGLCSPWPPVPCRGPGPGRLRPGHRYLSETVLQALEWGTSHGASCENTIFAILASQSLVSVNPRGCALGLCPGQLGPWEEAPVTAFWGTRTETWPQARISPGCGRPCSAGPTVSAACREAWSAVRKTGRRHAGRTTSSTLVRGTTTRPHPQDGSGDGTLQVCPYYSKRGHTQGPHDSGHDGVGRRRPTLMQFN